MANSSKVAIVGGGPAGLVLSYLLARQGIPVTLLEMHQDFDRDFRGDTVHASTLELFEQLGLVDEVLALPHQKIRSATINSPTGVLATFDFTGVYSKYKFMAMMPQVHLLDFLVKKCERFPNFSCIMGAAVNELHQDGEHVRGISYKRDDGTHTLEADLVVGADGRFSRLRKLAKLAPKGESPPMDVAWFKIPKATTDPADNAGFFVHSGTMLILISRQQQWQVGYVFAKGDFSNIQQAGLDSFKANLFKAAPFLSNRSDAITGWEQIHLLSIKSDCLETWCKPGLLLIGDAAHAMSPVGGVGINCAIGDAVAATNLLSRRLLKGEITLSDLRAVQSHRTRAIGKVQRFQGVIQDRLVKLAINDKPFKLPWFAKMLLSTPGLKNIPANLFAKGPAAVTLDKNLL